MIKLVDELFNSGKLETINANKKMFGVKEVDMALRYIKEDQENYIPHDSFQEETLNELESFALIRKLPNHNYVLTQKGKDARQLGAYNYIKMKKAENYFLNYTPEKHTKKKKLIETSFIIALVFILILFVVFREDFFS